MFVKKKTRAFDWYMASVFFYILQTPTFYLYNNGAVNSYVVWIAGVLIPAVSVYLVVWLNMYLYYKKSFNFYTSHRFKNERKVAAGTGLITIMFFLIPILWGEPISIEHVLYIPSLIFAIYYMLYMFAYLFGLRNPYYDDSLG